MGLLTLGTPLAWDEAASHADHVRCHGILQFLNIYNDVHDRTCDSLLWGDEVEYSVVDSDIATRRVALTAHAYTALENLQGVEALSSARERELDSRLDKDLQTYHSSNKGISRSKEHNNNSSPSPVASTTHTVGGASPLVETETETDIEEHSSVSTTNGNANNVNKAIQTAQRYVAASTAQSSLQKDSVGAVGGTAGTAATVIEVLPSGKPPTTAAVHHHDSDVDLISTTNRGGPTLATATIPQFNIGEDSATATTEDGSSAGVDQPDTLAASNRDSGFTARGLCDEENRRAKLDIVADLDALRHRRSSSNTLQELALKRKIDPSLIDSSWKPEYGRFMLEATPAKPYGATLSDFLCVETNIINRRQLAQAFLKPTESLLTLTNYPLLGCHNFYKLQTGEDSGETYPQPTPTDNVTKSLFIPTSSINPHARFPTLSANIRSRRGSKVVINLPIFKDKNTPSPFLEPIPESVKNLTYDEIINDVIRWSASDGQSDKQVESFKKKYPTIESFKSKDNQPKLVDLVRDAKPDFVYMDAMCFGMGCSCLQVTFQACNITDARRMYDQLANITPIMLAISASAPIFRGYLVDTDCRWDVVSASVDDRTTEERGIKPLEKSKFKLAKSRYDSISVFLSQGPNPQGCKGKASHDYYKEEYNDLNPAIDPKIKQKLIKGGLDELIARHYAHLFTRDPLVIFKELIDQDDSTSSDHFENIQSTNWQTVRFKPPPPKQTAIGWRVEFRSMEVQLTDFENSAFAIFIVLFVRAVARYNLNLYIPLSKVDSNMKRSQLRDAIGTQKFWFRANMDPRVPGNLEAPDSETIIEMTVDEIINGKPDTFGYPGLIPIVRKYLEDAVINKNTATTTGETSTESESEGLNTPPLSQTGSSSTHNKEATPCGSQAMGAKKSVSQDDLFDFGLHESDNKRLHEYLDLIANRANGKLMTGAKFIRQFVDAHPDYKHDSVISQSITYDLIKKLDTLNTGKLGPSVPGLNML